MNRYRIYSDYLKERYGEKVYKLPVSLPVTCPNRDGTCGTGGCVFCGEIGAGYENLPASMTVAMQLDANREHIAPKYKVNKFIPYFQNFSNTYLPVEKLRVYLMEACENSRAHGNDVVGLAIATRPDCVHPDYLALFQEIRQFYGVDIFLELGLQTVNYHTLEKIRRGHSLAEYIEAVLMAKEYKIEVCTHLILNLPWDDECDVIENAKLMSALHMDQVKLHALYIVKNTVMAEWYQAGEFTLISKDEYIQRVVTFLNYLHPKVVVQRLLGRAPETNTLFSNWQTSWWKIRDEIEQVLIDSDSYQGKQCDYLTGKQVRKFLPQN
ncbi:radical SAM protein (TIGR01212 family) [Sporomusaceae bacterium BoRhaA]|uniref:TIGR01212 family radical SAM protein n=1 Tax=Pelorhabdus rhamnosifermentans TaxID=2772457 RepID=UPI001C0613E6|nr:TIGR01212 family radical SAM protein [Pelorhabdus rhamnosifermentans]MBU2702392.1 radical SAM protein (TIGR01212 family) [Pelorhabdus rhamnosifermentans]